MRDRAREADDQTDIAVALEQDYFEWGVRCGRKDPAMHSVAIAWLGMAVPLSELDRRYRKRNGWARALLFDGLVVYCEMKRWG